MRNESRFYEIGGISYPSVTTILQVINKPGLIQWFINKQKEEIEQKSQEALDIGKQTHETIAMLTQQLLGNPIHVDPALENSWPIQQWKQWVSDERLEFLESESVVYCPVCQYAGTPDFVAIQKKSDANRLIPSQTLPSITTHTTRTTRSSNAVGESIDKGTNAVGESIDKLKNIYNLIVIGDYKTSKAIYPEYELQVVAYAHAWLSRLGIDHKVAKYVKDFLRLCIIRLPKGDQKDCLEVKWLDKPPALDLFLAARDLWLWQHASKT